MAKNWKLTLFWKLDWQKYYKRLENAETEFKYKTDEVPADLTVGDKVYLVHKGKVKGWHRVRGLLEENGKNVVIHGGNWHDTEETYCKGFKGILEHKE